jgi:hypothetical protein
MKSFESFSVGDIRKFRNKESKKLLKMTNTEILAYYHDRAEKVLKEMQEYREEKARAETAEQAKEA